ncbi:MAG: phenylalanine--tRNA ligase subunit alpha [Candidatus Tritonobacter lacicola]|nr:phenylalanine--tRNA ligase subunit alpha [Candidatus Tritonobacter lacicola]
MDFAEKIERIRQQAESDIRGAEGLPALESVRARYLGRKGEITEILKGLRLLPPGERPKAGKLANDCKVALTELLGARSGELAGNLEVKRLKDEEVDVTLPAGMKYPGKLHPITRVFDEVIRIFASMGFTAVDSPEIETDYYNFEALNFQADHPARDMQDTFYLSGGKLLRTHTSPAQIRIMEERDPPLAVIAPGKCYRCDADVSHSPMFHQVEGFLVDEKVTFADLKGVLTAFVHGIFSPDVKLRFRPSFFPFTEPSAEIDISCVSCGGAGCRLCGGAGWLEILGAGMIHPSVLESVKYDTGRFQGFAFGMGIERIAMLKYGIDDIRLFFDNDIRFIRQF